MTAGRAVAWHDVARRLRCAVVLAPFSSPGMPHSTRRNGRQVAFAAALAATMNQLVFATVGDERAGAAGHGTGARSATRLRSVAAGDARSIARRRSASV